MSISALLNPSSVAIFGASQNPEKIGGRPIRFMKEMGFTGAIYPINPQREEVQGLTCYPNLDALPGVPDTAIIAVPKDHVLETIKACASGGVKACVVMASGFGEAGDAGKAAEKEMLAIAVKTGMRIVGPNSQGLANFHNGAVLNFSTMFIEEPPKAGPVACISQSGAMSVVPYGMLRQRGFGVGHCHATGNDADVT
ncbi:MAG: CoA-binding protein, partial [Sulfitobacter sp.]